jgi:cytochrome c oxidase assembly protein subunit 15
MRSVGSLDGFRRFAWGVLAYNILVILWGAYVRASGSGAGCGDHWPLCNGQVVPRAPRIETMIEYSHRLTSGLSVIVVVGLCAWAFLLFPRGNRVRKLAGASVVFLFVEAILGAGLVLFNVGQTASIGHTIYLSAHLANTLLLLAALVLTAWFAEGSEARLRLREIPWPFWATLPLAMFVCITGTVAALGDTAFPSASLSAGIRQDFSPTASFLVRLRMFHPFVAAISGLLFAAVAVFALRVTERPKMRALAMTIVIVTFVQLCAGVLNLALLAPVWMQILHLFLADIVWIALVLFVAEAARPISVPLRR